MRTKEDYIMLLEETVKFYSEDTTRRSMDSTGDCKYFGPDGKKCAVGRWIDPNKYNSDFEGHTIKSSVMDALVEEKRGYSFLFWNRLQILHDAEENWDENGLTEVGKENLKKIYLQIDQII